MVPFTCPRCRTVSSLPDDGAGFLVLCKECGAPLVARQTEADGAAVPLFSPPPMPEPVQEPAPPRSRLLMRTRCLLAHAEQIQRGFGPASLIRIRTAGAQANAPAGPGDIRFKNINRTI